LDHRKFEWGGLDEHIHLAAMDDVDAEDANKE